MDECSLNSLGQTREEADYCVIIITVVTEFRIPMLNQFKDPAILSLQSLFFDSVGAQPTRRLHIEGG